MPGFITHYFFGRNVSKALENQPLKTILEENHTLFYLGTQGPDLFFYDLLSLRYSDHRNLGSYLHENQIQDFFHFALDELQTLKRVKDREACLAYICGFLCHYKLDHHAHPFIYGRTGYDVHTSGHDYYPKHFQLETEIDRYLLKEWTGKKLTDFPQASFFYLDKATRSLLSSFLSNVISHTVGKKKPVLSSHLQPRFIKFILLEAYVESKILMDPHSYKKNFFATLEKTLKLPPLLSSKFITNHQEDLDDFLNKKQTTWENPWDRSIRSKDSFPMIYKNAKRDCIQLLSQLDITLLCCCKNKNYTRSFSEKIGNYSYHSGLPVKSR